jgi:nitroreductase/NAD-dependent dihydropyrimidine dehydrogenase PreA subunit
MAKIRIDPEVCVKDRICELECPYGVLTTNEGEEPAHPVPGREEACIKCGHCVAFCPTGAVEVEGVDAEELERSGAGGVTAQQAAALLKRRRSIRSYKPRELSREEIEAVLDVARWAPSARNQQPVEWVVSQSRESTIRLAELAVDFMRGVMDQAPEAGKAHNFDAIINAWDNGADVVLRGAPHVVAAHAPADLPFSAHDCAIALTYLELAAFSQGLGTCWAGYLTYASMTYAPLQEFLGIPDGRRVFGAVMLGEPRFRPQRIPKRRETRVRYV